MVSSFDKLRLVTDGQTDRQTRRHSIYCASIALRGRKVNLTHWCRSLARLQACNRICLCVCRRSCRRWKLATDNWCASCSSEWTADPWTLFNVNVNWPSSSSFIRLSSTVIHRVRKKCHFIFIVAPFFRTRRIWVRSRKSELML